MDVSGLWIFVAGFMGGVLAEFLGVWSLRTQSPSTWPEHYKRPVYWLISLVMALLGGGLAMLYGLKEMPILLALNIGASAPLAISRIVSIAPPPPPTVPPSARVD